MSNVHVGFETCIFYLLYTIFNFFISDTCARIQCGPNADCVASNHAASCQCRADYEGDPSNLSVGCRPRPVVCSSQIDCSVNTYCYEGICRRE